MTDEEKKIVQTLLGSIEEYISKTVSPLDVEMCGGCIMEDGSHADSCNYLITWEKLENSMEDVASLCDPT